MPRFSLPLRPDDICHHGVEGMRWGVKNGPPYPLDESISTGKKLKHEPDDKYRMSSETNNMLKPGNKHDIVYTTKAANTHFFKTDTVPKVREYISLRNSGKYDEANQKLKEAASSKAMKKFFSDKDVKKSYETRNKHYDNASSYGNSDDPDKEYFDAAKRWQSDIKKHIEKFFGSYANKPYSNTNKNTNGKLMEKLLEYMDTADDDVIEGLYPYAHPYAWRWYS